MIDEVYLRTIARILQWEPGEITDRMVRKWYPRLTKPTMTDEDLDFVKRMVDFNRMMYRGPCSTKGR